MIEIFAGILLVLGGVFVLIAAVGVLRMTDFFMRTHAATKAGTLGSSLILLGMVVYFREMNVATRACATIIFFFLTAPVAAHCLGRSAYRRGVPLWSGTLKDDLKGRYDDKTESLKSPGQI